MEVTKEQMERWYNDPEDQKAIRKAREKFEDKNYRGERQTGKGYMNPDIPRYAPKPDRNCIRIIRPFEYHETEYYGQEIWIHRNIGPSNDIYICVNWMGGKYCPICEMQAGLWDTAGKDAAKVFYPNMRIMMWVLDLTLDKNHENFAKPLLFSCPKSLALEISAQSEDPETGAHAPVSPPKEGRAVYFTRTGEGLNTTYGGVKIGSQAVPLPMELMKEIMPFADALNFATADEIKEAIGTLDIKQEESAGAQERPECYGKEFGRYGDCESDCAFIEPCAKECGWSNNEQSAEAEPKTEEATSQIPTVSVEDEDVAKKPEETKATAPNGEAGSSNIKDKLAEAIEARKRRKMDS